jgi:hypothetical protein
MIKFAAPLRWTPMFLALPAEDARLAQRALSPATEKKNRK